MDAQLDPHDAYARLCKDLGVLPSVLSNLGRDAALVRRRRLVIAALYSIERLSFNSIGKLLNRDHSTVIHQWRKFMQLPLPERTMWLARARRALT